MSFAKSLALGARTSEKQMTTVIIHHDIEVDLEHWLTSPKRKAGLEPIGVTNIRTFVDPQNSAHVAACCGLRKLRKLAPGVRRCLSVATWHAEIAEIRPGGSKVCPSRAYLEGAALSSAPVRRSAVRATRTQGQRRQESRPKLWHSRNEGLNVSPFEVRTSRAQVSSA